MSARTAQSPAQSRSSAGLPLAPLLPGLIQHWKARLQGRRGPSPLQPYRELRRLWGKSAVDVEGTTAVYRLAPAIVAASARRCGAARAGRRRPRRASGVGHDALALVGLLALAPLRGRGCVLGRRQRLLAHGREPRPDALGLRRGDARARRSRSRRSSPERPTSRGIVAGDGRQRTSGRLRRSRSAALAFALVVVAETGRQPVDNPDTHLELTMIHEGPLLEYAGRDLAYLQWAAAARHWLVLVLAAQVFLPHPARRLVAARAAPARRSRVLCGALALVETLAREDAHPARSAADRRRRGSRAARHRHLAGGVRMSGTLAWALVALGLGVVVVRRRSIAVGLVTAQALSWSPSPLDQAKDARRHRRRRARSALRGARARARCSCSSSRARGRRVRCARASRRSSRAGLAVAVRARADLARAERSASTRATAERAMLALVAFGLVTVATRRATLFQVLGIVLVENGLALAALELPGGASLAIELGVALDLLLVALVAGVFHERIFAEFGAGDTAALRSLRD